MNLYDPYGVNPKSGDIRKNVYTFYQGDSIVLDLPAKTPLNEPVTPDNVSDISFTLVDKRFSTDIVWDGDLTDGISILKDGVVRIAVPNRISNNLRRGSFMYSLTVTDKSARRKLVEEGSLLIEFGADAPNIDLAYKSVVTEEDSNQNDE